MSKHVDANPYKLPPNLPAPIDDVEAAHLAGMEIPGVLLPGSDGAFWNLRQLTRHRAVVYFYPATGVPGRDPVDGWDEIPGAPGCTVQSMGYIDRYAKFQEAGIEIIGLSTQPPSEQKEFVYRMRVPFLLLSDVGMALQDSLRLPYFKVDGRTFYRRLTIYVENAIIRHTFYPVFPPDEDAERILEWIKVRRR
jgi:peroxiredoxin